MTIFLGVLTMGFASLLFAWAVLRAQGLAWPPSSLARLPILPPAIREPRSLGGNLVPAATLNLGREQYTLYCRACHGDRGDGRGTAGQALRPPPRDFSQGLFKFGGTPAPSLPPDAALARIVRDGLHGTAMHPWDLHPDTLAAILQYIKTFSPRWKTEAPGLPVEIGPDPFGPNGPDAPHAPKGPFPSNDPRSSSPSPARRAEAIRLGRRLYHEKAQCSSCHPAYLSHRELSEMALASGKPAPVFSPEMYTMRPKESEYCLRWEPAEPNAGQTRDQWIESRECASQKKADGEVSPMVARVVPPDFTRTPLRSVRLPRFAPPSLPSMSAWTERTAELDLYRVIAAGIGGANMPAWKGALGEDELWALVYYVKSLVDLGADPGRADELSSELLSPANLHWVAPTPSARPPTASP